MFCNNNEVLGVTKSEHKSFDTMLNETLRAKKAGVERKIIKRVKLSFK